MSASSPQEFASDAKPVLSQTSWATASRPGCTGGLDTANGANSPSPPPPPSPSSNGATTQDVPWRWTPMWHRDCTFGPDEFDAVMQNLVRNPNNLSSWLFRADIVYSKEDGGDGKGGEAEVNAVPDSQQAIYPVEALPNFAGLHRHDGQTIVRRLIPRNTMRDAPMLQTCVFYKGEMVTKAEHNGDDEHEEEEDERVSQLSLVVYLPHVATAAGVPFYHPKVRGVGFLHEWCPNSETGHVSTHFSFFPENLIGGEGEEDAEGKVDSELLKKVSRPVLSRVGLSLLQTVHKHGEGKRAGYTKRVHHDQLVPQARVQDRYMRLKARHARRLVRGWQETTDPDKHVFEDLSIAAFLMELWDDMYGDKKSKDSKTDKKKQDKAPASFPGFVDIGCGNGLLVHVLNKEGYRGWGFDARHRRSWEQYGSKVDTQGDTNKLEDSLSLQKRLLLPYFLVDEDDSASPEGTHDGRFPPGTFIIANHADELTVWAPLLAALSGCPFLTIPCCSHNFTGSKFRAPPPPRPKKSGNPDPNAAAASKSTYNSFVEWVAAVSEACGWVVEREMLRIPSTRNVGLLGRRRRRRQREDDSQEESVDGDDDDNQASKDKPEQDKSSKEASIADTPHLSIDGAWAVINQFGGAGGFAATVAKLAQQEHKSSH